MLDIFKAFIEKNPNNVLGELKGITDRFGNPDVKVIGSVDELNKISVTERDVPEKNKDTQNIITLNTTLSEETYNLRKSLSKNELEKGIDKIQTKTKRKKSKKKQYILPADLDQELYKGDEAFSILNGNIFTNEFLDVWYWYHTSNGKPINKYFEKFSTKDLSDDWFEKNILNGNLCYDTESSSYVPSVLYYSGNIYDKIISLNSFPVNNKFTENQKQKQLKKLNNILPNPIILTGAKSERLVIDVLSKFARTFEIMYDDEKITIQEAFKSFINNLENEDFKYDLRPYQITSYYIRGDRFPNGSSSYEKAEIKRKSALECVYQMDIFLSEVISDEDRKRIETIWNRTNNGYVDTNFDGIPLYFEFSKYFKDSNLEIRPAQREGVAFNSTNGTGIIAYDVGVGKTLTSIINVANAIQSGACKRPLFVVPKQTYDKWISEITGIYDDKGNLVGSGILPQYPIYDLFNLSKKIAVDVIDENGYLKDLPETCILMTTYQGMANIGFGDEESSQFMTELKEILNQGFGDESERQKALDDEKLNKKIGVGIEGTVINIEDIDADYLVIDEAHNMNKIFSGVKGEVDKSGREKSQYQIKGSESARGIKSFFISNFIQRNSNGNGNVCLLTATPFTNSPLEVYNMLALTNVKRLRGLGILNINSFFDNYVNQTFEKVVKQNGQIEESAVIKGWTNKIALQKILFGYMNYKSGEDANIQRPVKFTLPKLSEVVDGVRVPLTLESQIPTFLQPTQRQKDIQKEISEWLIEQMKDEEASKKAPHLVADIKAKKNCISPYIYEDTHPSLISPKDFINSSPKLKYTMECIKSVVYYHKKSKTPISGQVIYINGGINYLELVKNYLIEEIGYKKNVAKNGTKKFFDEVEVLVGGGANTPKSIKRNDDEKEEIKDLFNKGTIKIIIGSSTIREGIDLQKKSSTLYNLWVDWNPTDYKQLEGRVWRYGNIFDNVRIVTPLLVGSSDAFTFQKLEEKTARINDIFDRNDRSNILDVSDQDREEVKWALIDDLSEVAKAKIKDLVNSLKKKKDVVNTNIEFIKSIDFELNQQERKKTGIANAVSKFWEFADYDNKDSDRILGDIDMIRIIKRQKNDIIEKRKSLGLSSYYDTSEIYTAYRDSKEFKKKQDKLDKLDEKMEQQYGTSIYEDTSSILSRLETERSAIEDEIIVKGSEDNILALTLELEEERSKFNSGLESFDVTVGKFKKLNYLLDAVKRENNKVIKEVDSKVIESIIDKSIDVTPEKIDNEDSIEIAIESLTTLLEFTEGDEEKSIKEAIESLEILIM